MVLMVNTRFQVVEEPHGYGYEVKDMATGDIVSIIYATVAWAAKRAIRENEATKYLTRSKPFLREI